MNPLAIDLFCGLGGWTEGLLAEGWHVVGFDIERHQYGDMQYPAQMVLQDVLTLDGAQFKDADLIVASPPCQEFSYMAMPFSRGKQIEKALLGAGEFPDNYKGSRTRAELTALFDACFRIQAEASGAAGRLIPLIVENVRGAQKWVGRSRWNFGSYHLWGDVPALMPITLDRAFKNPGQDWSRYNKTGKVSPHWNQCGSKQGCDWFSDSSPGTLRHEFGGSDKRKRASALIAKIPFELARHIGRVFYPNIERQAS